MRNAIEGNWQYYDDGTLWIDDDEIGDLADLSPASATLEEAQAIVRLMAVAPAMARLCKEIIYTDAYVPAKFRVAARDALSEAGVLPKVVAP